MHAKTFAVDRRLVFVGSFNLDPRSAALNTESGPVIDSPAMASNIAMAFENQLAERSYALRLNGDGAIGWLARTLPTASLQVHHTEPRTTV